MNRRGLLKSSASALTFIAVPAPVLAALPAIIEPVLKSYAVGTDSGEMDWEFILAESAELAEKLYAESNGFECDCPDKNEECHCFAYIDSQRVAAWDELDASGPSAVDWVSAGLSHSCTICHEECSSEIDIITIGTRRFIVCEYCRADAQKGKFNLPASLGFVQ